MRPALRFLARFLVFSLLLFVLWRPIARLYLVSVTSAVNALGDLAHRPVRYVLAENGWWILYDFRPEEFRLFVGNSDVPCLNLIVYIALAAAFGFASWKRGCVRLFVGVCILWVSHTLHYWFLPRLAVWQYLWSTSRREGGLSDYLESIAVSAASVATSEQALVLHRVLGSWRNIGMWALAFAVWFLLRDRSEAPIAGKP